MDKWNFQFSISLFALKTIEQPRRATELCQDSFATHGQHFRNIFVFNSRDACACRNNLWCVVKTSCWAVLCACHAIITRPIFALFIIFSVFAHRKCMPNAHCHAAPSGMRCNSSSGWEEEEKDIKTTRNRGKRNQGGCPQQGGKGARVRRRGTPLALPFLQSSQHIRQLFHFYAFIFTSAHEILYNVHLYIR